MYINRNPEYFLTIAREQNITRAADRLYITQSSLSQYLSKLERELDVTLFDRTKSPIELTEAGKIYKQYLESSNYLYQKLMTDLNSARVQTVSLGIGNWRASILLPQILPGFLESHPNAELRLHEYPVSELPSRVVDGKVDFAIMNTSPANLPGTIISQTIGNERILLVMRRDHPIAQEYIESAKLDSPVDLLRLETMRFIALDSNLTVGRHVSSFIKQRSLVFPQHLSTTNNRTALRLTSEGMGFCFMIESGLQDSLDENLAVFDLDIPELSIPMSFLYRENAYRSPVVQAFMDAICDYYTSILGHAHGIHLLT